MALRRLASGRASRFEPVGGSYLMLCINWSHLDNRLPSCGPYPDEVYTAMRLRGGAGGRSFPFRGLSQGVSLVSFHEPTDGVS